MLGQSATWLERSARILRPAHRSALLRCEALEAREVPAGIFVAGVGGITQATDPEVSLYATSGSRQGQGLGIQLEAFGGTVGDTRIAFGDVNADGTDDIITTAGVGGGSEVAIFDGKAALSSARIEIARFFVYSDVPGVSTSTSGFDGGVFVASADLNGDGFAELITTPGEGGRGHLKVFDFNNGSGVFLGSAPTLRASAHTFTDYNGEIRVTTLQANGRQFVVAASGAGAVGDVRVYQDVYTLGSVADGVSVSTSFLVARFVPVAGFTGGLSVAAGDTDRDGSDELFVSKNNGASNVAVYDGNLITDATLFVIATRRGEVPTVTTFEAFAGFLGEVRLGAADVDGDGRVEAIVTTGFSGDSQGTPVKAFTRDSGGTKFGESLSFYLNPGYQLGAWLGGKDFTYSTDLTDPTVIDNFVAGSLPAVFTNNISNPNNAVDTQDVGLVFPRGASVLPVETVTGALLAIKNVEVSFSFAHAIPDQVRVTLAYANPAGETASLVLFDGARAGRDVLANGLQLTFTDNTTTTVPAGIAGAPIVGRFRPDGTEFASLRDFVGGRKNGYFVVIFEDLTPDDDGTVTTTVTPQLRLLY